ncbi:hypothetical protein ACGF3G_00530 [Streptomyces sp. NPDC048179]|uniref:hypothetical protein n=1 Tax=Streptomyces sp. NPDC048179 TaxID=3365506 RepID=UPI00371DA801
MSAAALRPPAAESVVMPTDYAEYMAMRRENPRPGPCCTTAGPVEHWPMFHRCGGGNGPGRTIRPHCTCDRCF